MWLPFIRRYSRSNDRVLLELASPSEQAPQEPLQASLSGGFFSRPSFSHLLVEQEGFVSRCRTNRGRAPSPFPTLLLSKRSKQRCRYNCCHVFAHVATVIGEHWEQR